MIEISKPSGGQYSMMNINHVTYKPEQFTIAVTDEILVNHVGGDIMHSPVASAIYKQLMNVISENLKNDLENAFNNAGKTFAFSDNSWLKTLPPIPAGNPTSAPADGSSILAVFRKMIPGIESIHQKCPECSLSYDLPHTIIHINDTHKWTREKIADWLETLDVDLTIHPANEAPSTPKISDSALELWKNYSAIQKKITEAIKLPPGDMKIELDKLVAGGMYMSVVKPNSDSIIKNTGF